MGKYYLGEFEIEELEDTIVVAGVVTLSPHYIKKLINLIQHGGTSFRVFVNSVQTANFAKYGDFLVCTIFGKQVTIISTKLSDIDYAVMRLYMIMPKSDYRTLYLSRIADKHAALGSLLKATGL